MYDRGALLEEDEGNGVVVEAEAEAEAAGEVKVLPVAINGCVLWKR
jgi:hypothetical protein